MLDFVSIKTATAQKRGRPKSAGGPESVITIFPEFIVGKTEDLMVRGGAFYAVWDDASSVWSTDTRKLIDLVDGMVKDYQSSYPDDVPTQVKLLRFFSSGKWTEFINYCKNMPDCFHELDTKLTFADDVTVREDYTSKRLPYSLDPGGDISAYDSLMSVLYSPLERQKIEWAIGSIVAGDSVSIQKFIVLYGPAGSGKSTVLNLIDKLFQGYTSVFEAKAIGSASNVFALESFRNNPLVSIQHDGDLSRIEDNTKLNSIVSHEKMTVNEKFRSTYSSTFNTFLFMGTNRPVRITDSKSGIMRRLIDVTPTGNTVAPNEYRTLVSRMDFELGAIASHCLEVYSEMGRDAYSAYRSAHMMSATNDFYNFMCEYHDVMAAQQYVTLRSAYIQYKKYCEEANVRHPYSMTYFREELRSYFKEYKDRVHVNDDGKDQWYRSVYIDLDESKFAYESTAEAEKPVAQQMLELNGKSSLLDEYLKDCPAQYASSDGVPTMAWKKVTTKLSDIDTSRLHYVRVPEKLICIDFDLIDDSGQKSLEKSLRMAQKWPPTYAELSQSGKGVHLHYIYDGDPKELAREYSDRVEIKVYTGLSSLRRKLTQCNSKPIAHLSGGLPKKEERGDDVIDFEGLANEKALRTVVRNSMAKKYCPGTKPSVDFIFKAVSDFYASGKHYDITDMRPAVTAFANNSTHHPLYCLEVVSRIPWHSEDTSEGEDWPDSETNVYYDVEVFPNLFIVVWKPEGKQCVKMINPTPSDVEKICRLKLIGFNNRKYDNHIMYARMLGYSNRQLYELSHRIVNGSRNAMFREAYNLSYADIYDFSSKKQSLKKFEIDLGIHHQELGLPWDDEVPQELWEKVADYCVNDVEATEAVFHAREADFHAREMLADISGLKVNDTTRAHTTRIIFGKERHPQSDFVYTDLSEMFDGYKFENGKSSYRGEDPGEGGYVYAEPGYYEDVALLDIESMHPHSLIELNLFGPYTKNFKELLDARLAIKHGKYNEASKMMDGKLAPYLGNEEDAGKLAYALKIVINSVYGLTKASFDCEFKDPRNVDNIVAKRGALFMIDLKHLVQEKGFTVAHIKTDSIKIPNATPEIIKFVTEYGRKWGYNFDHEATYSKMCLVNQSVYIAKDASDGHWTATGKQFQVPYVFKTLFSKEELEWKDYCEARSVKVGDIYLDPGDDPTSVDTDNMVFVGKTGSFVPMQPGTGGCDLIRIADGKRYAVAGTKGYKWLESEAVNASGRHGDIDMVYYKKQAKEAIDTIEQYVKYEDLVSE